MHININPQKVNRIGMDLLELSRLLRHSRNEIEDVQHRLRQITELDECKTALRKEKEALAVLTARVINLSTALQEIAEIYQTTEERIESQIDGQLFRCRETSDVVIFGAHDTVHRRIQQILY